MLESVKSWIVSILIAAFIVNIVNMVLPSSKIKSYINLVLNFIFIFIVITPIINFFSDGISLEDRILKTYTKYNQEYIDSMNKLSKDTGNESLKSGYEEGIKSILQLKLDEYGYELEDIDVDGKDINKVKVKEKSSDEGKTNNAQSSNDEEDKQVFNEESNGKSKTEMKESLGDILDISIENIEID
ncbi:stage III sporulation protein AF [Paraclostridium sordellii]|uniref:stage III sporulation protein AF n=1 Tax=Paraclostridium sordellii TaxID=1505 RepID=UPI0005E705FF|nr:stage III sporulation protein AF [Paeniclostridium sordellii]QYE97481.1 stage III sporulation protein AF [Paeniclostridium sordellii]CEN79880.1 stage III sporulation protein AF [[Clostridium] sordellii] [Paeniclostridium sordellii]CEO12673.1 stage III sporulation protein AF [[Clostridium] sordellii] [Paeniclostridium sordellii]CEP87927.1 stage III sporulation protein AF [[Clostridium] sordellii] [Paeniclostridium sordellii]CEQ01025.1 stage III sporulation protein AF [[Clostridium] sordellii